MPKTVGLADWHSPVQWNLAKLPFSNTYLPLYADHVARVIASLRGKSRKCLVLDLDNTVWGGIIGDDGLEGIQIAQGDATGEAHLSVQRLALSLRERGVVLAVSSKNNDDVARLPFNKHPEMLLREDHIAVFQANWNDKATNIKAIAEELSLGIDSHGVAGRQSGGAWPGSPDSSPGWSSGSYPKIHLYTHALWLRRATSSQSRSPKKIFSAPVSIRTTLAASASRNRLAMWKPISRL